MTEQSPATIGTLPKSAFAQCLHALKDTKTFRLKKIAAKRKEERKKEFFLPLSIFKYQA